MSSYNAITPTPPPAKPAITGLQTSHKKSGLAMEMACEKLAGTLPGKDLSSEAFNRIGVMTLTFERQQLSFKEAKQELSNLLKALKRRYGNDLSYVWVQERHRSGGIHFHILLKLPFDTRTGTDIQALQNWEFIQENPYTRDRVKDCLPLVNERLRQEILELRELLPRYGIGRFDLLPILSDVNRVAGYFKKGIANHLANRCAEDKGARLWGCSKNVRACTTQSISLHTSFSTKLHQCIALWASALGLKDIGDVRRTVGRHWFFVFKQAFERYGEGVLHTLTPQRHASSNQLTL